MSKKSSAPLKNFLTLNKFPIIRHKVIASWQVMCPRCLLGLVTGLMEKGYSMATNLKLEIPHVKLHTTYLA